MGMSCQHHPYIESTDSLICAISMLRGLVPAHNLICITRHMQFGVNMFRGVLSIPLACYSAYCSVEYQLMATSERFSIGSY